MQRLLPSRRRVTVVRATWLQAGSWTQPGQACSPRRWRSEQSRGTAIRTDRVRIPFANKAVCASRRRRIRVPAEHGTCLAPALTRGTRRIGCTGRGRVDMFSVSHETIRGHVPSRRNSSGCRTRCKSPSWISSSRAQRGQLATSPLCGTGQASVRAQNAISAHAPGRSNGDLCGLSSRRAQWQRRALAQNARSRRLGIRGRRVVRGGRYKGGGGRPRFPQCCPDKTPVG